jgi:DNA-binding IclR family transcriptional regulator
MTLTAGSAAKVLVAYAPPAFQASVLEHSVYSAADLEKVRMARVAESIGEREPVLASASVPVRDATGVIAALSISGPVDRMGPSPAALHREALQDAAAELEAHLR